MKLTNCDFFLATVIFGDIAGFTAWSSQREPPQVFMLLESIFGAFDKIAYKHGIFKVETVSFLGADVVALSVLYVHTFS